MPTDEWVEHFPKVARSQKKSREARKKRGKRVECRTCGWGGRMKGFTVDSKCPKCGERVFRKKVKKHKPKVKNGKCNCCGQVRRLGRDDFCMPCYRSGEVTKIRQQEAAREFHAELEKCDKLS